MAIATAAAATRTLEGNCYSALCGNTNPVAKAPFDGLRVAEFAGLRSSFRCRSPLSGSRQFHWLALRHDASFSKVSVAADYSDSVPDSSSYLSKQGYHPLEELKVSRKVRQTKLSSAEIARTTVKANSNALLVFPGIVHCEPHENKSWGEFQYLIDDYGDIFIVIFDDANILEDPGASNLVNAFIGTDTPIYENGSMTAQYGISNIGNEDDFLFDKDSFEDSRAYDRWIGGGALDNSMVHPVYFAKCLTKAVNMECNKMMDGPSNGVSILGCLRPTFADEEAYVRRLCGSEDIDEYDSAGKDEESFSSSVDDRRKTDLTLYRLEIIKIELCTMYGSQSEVSVEDFQDAEADVLVHSSSAILERFSQGFDVALKALCKKKGLHVEGATLIGVDSLGIDVRVVRGIEVKTHRFPFKIKATSEVAAEKQIQRLLFPQSRRKRSMNSWKRS